MKISRTPLEITIFEKQLVRPKTVKSQGIEELYKKIANKLLQWKWSNYRDIGIKGREKRQTRQKTALLEELFLKLIWKEEQRPLNN